MMIAPDDRQYEDYEEEDDDDDTDYRSGIRSKWDWNDRNGDYDY
jgi:hypothetical protein